MRPVDWLLLGACAALVLAGPAMALQELARAQSDVGLEVLTGEDRPVEPAFRVAWRAGLLVLVVATGILGTFFALRVARQPRVRSVSGRLMWLLLGGMTLLDLAFLADGRWFVLAPYALRGTTVVWLYPVAGVLMGGAVIRLAELESAFGEGRRA